MSRAHARELRARTHGAPRRPSSWTGTQRHVSVATIEGSTTDVIGQDEVRARRGPHSRAVVQRRCPTSRTRPRRPRRSRPTAPSSRATRSASGSPRCSRWSVLKQEMSPDRFIDIPGAVIDIYKTYRPSPAAARAPARARPRPARRREDLLQVRGREPGRLAQAQHRDPAGVLQQAGGHHQDLHRDRCGPVGLGARRSPVLCTASTSRSSW